MSRGDSTGLPFCREAVKMEDKADNACDSPAQSGRGPKSSTSRHCFDTGM